MPFIPRQETFHCDNCGTLNEPLEHGTYRNHCKECLFSKHVDLKGPGDRAAECASLMKPIAIEPDTKIGWILTHRCVKCNKQIRNKTAPDDNLDIFLKNTGE